jgi:hypothetical protein
MPFVYLLGEKPTLYLYERVEIIMVAISSVFLAQSRGTIQTTDTIMTIRGLEPAEPDARIFRPRFSKKMRVQNRK